MSDLILVCSTHVRTVAAKKSLRTVNVLRAYVLSLRSVLTLWVPWTKVSG